MRKILILILQAIFGSFIGTVFWTGLISIFVIPPILQSGYIDFQVFGSGGIDPKILFVLGAILGSVQGLFIGFLIGIFNKNNALTGGLIGFATTEILLFSFYISSTLQTISNGKSVLRAIELLLDSSFGFFSFLLFIPSVFLGFLMTKIFILTKLIKPKRLSSNVSFE